MAFIAEAAGGLFGGSGPDNIIKSTVNVHNEQTNTLLTSDSSTASGVADSNADVVAADLNQSGDHNVMTVGSKAETQQTITNFTKNSSKSTLESHAMEKLEQLPEVDLEGGLFAPTVNSDTTMNMTGAMTNATSSFTSTAASALGHAHATTKVGNMTQTGSNNTMAVEAVAHMDQFLTLSNTQVKENSNMNGLTLDIVQSPKVTAKSDMVASVQAVTDMVSSVFDSLAGGGILILVIGAVVLYAAYQFMPKLDIPEPGATGQAGGLANAAAAQKYKQTLTTMAILSTVGVAALAFAFMWFYDSYALTPTIILLVGLSMTGPHYLLILGQNATPPTPKVEPTQTQPDPPKPEGTTVQLEKPAVALNKVALNKVVPE
jgi:hypothetical protein